MDNLFSNFNNTDELMECVTVLGNYDVLSNDNDEVLIAVPGKFNTDIDNPKFYYDGGAHGILFRNDKNIVICDELNPGVRDIILKNKELYIDEPDNDLAPEYSYMAKLVHYKGAEKMANYIIEMYEAVKERIADREENYDNSYENENESYADKLTDLVLESMEKAYFQECDGNFSSSFLTYISSLKTAKQLYEVTKSDRDIDTIGLIYKAMLRVHPGDASLPTKQECFKKAFDIWRDLFSRCKDEMYSQMLGVLLSEYMENKEIEKYDFDFDYNTYKTKFNPNQVESEIHVSSFGGSDGTNVLIYINKVFDEEPEKPVFYIYDGVLYIHRNDNTIYRVDYIYDTALNIMRESLIANVLEYTKDDEELYYNVPVIVIE